MTAPTVSQFLTAMRSFLGVIESPYGSNRTRVGFEFGWNGVAWCAQTISVACHKAGWGQTFWSASTDIWELNAKNGINGAKWISASTTPKPGDIAVWDYKRDGTANHVSAVESVRSDGMLITIGGNESNRCQRAVRSKTALRGYVRLPFRVVVAVPNPTPAPKPVTAPKPPAVKPLPFRGDAMFTLFYVTETNQYYSLTPWGLNKLGTTEGYGTDSASSLNAVVVPTSAAMKKIAEGIPRLY